MGSSRTDADLLAASQAGRVAAFGTLIERHQSLVCGVCYSATGNWALAEDVAQETFLAAWSGIGTLREPSRFRAWICQIARNLSAKALRKRGREVPLEGIDPVTEQTPLDDVIDKESEALVWGSMKEIPLTYREPLVLFYQDGRSAREIAEALDITEVAVHQRLSRGRKQLKESVSNIVERTLSQRKPRSGFAAATVAALYLRWPNPASAAEPETPVAATGDTSMLIKTIAVAAVGALVVGAGWVAGRDEPAGDSAAAVAPAADPPAAGSTPRRVSPSAQTPARPAPATLIARPTTATPPTPARKPEASHHAQYLLTGVERDWADGKLGALLDECFAPIGGPEKEFGFTLEFNAEGRPTLHWQRGAAADDAAVVRCAERKLTAFGLTPLAGERAALTVKYGAAKPPPEFDEEAAAALTTDHAPSRGPESAKHTMVIFTGFRCVYCGNLLGTIDQLLEEYPSDLRVVIKPFALRDEDVIITEAAFAAEAQGKFWSMHDAMFADQDGLNAKTVRTYAVRAGLDMARFDAAMAARTFRELVTAIQRDGKAVGIRGIPAVILDGQHLMGALPVERYRAVLRGDDPAAAKVPARPASRSPGSSAPR